MERRLFLLVVCPLPVAAFSWSERKLKDMGQTYGQRHAQRREPA